MAEALYLHVPFCSAICYYCDFHRSLYNEAIVYDWLTAIADEIKAKQIQQNVKTIYIGGGTPSALTVSQLQQLFTLIEPYATQVEEFTIESNLESITEEKLILMQQYGVNRISLGVQSYDDDLLEYMNRKHRVVDIAPTIEMIAEYIPNISIDLIYGFASQTLAMWAATLEQAVCNPLLKHISVYSLTIETKSVFAKKGYETVSNEQEAKMYNLAIEQLEKHGFHQYEVANFAKAGYESKHNQYYWRYEDFYGIGVGASGKENNQRYSNDFTLSQYITREGVANVETLQRKDQMFEFIMMNLRLRKGLDIQRFDQLFNQSFTILFADLIMVLTTKQDAYIEAGFFVVSKQGMFYLHDILILFMEVLDERNDSEA